MGLTDLAMRPLRAVLGSAEEQVEETLPVREIEDIQKQILEGVSAMRRATDSIESHVAVVEALANTLPALTLAVEELTVQLGEIVTVLAPVTEAERDVARVEHEFTRLGGLLGRRREHEAPPPDPGGAEGTPPPER